MRFYERLQRKVSSAPSYMLGECVGLENSAVSIEDSNSGDVNELTSVRPFVTGWLVGLRYQGSGFGMTHLWCTRGMYTVERLRFADCLLGIQRLYIYYANTPAMVDTVDDLAALWKGVARKGQIGSLEYAFDLTAVDLHEMVKLAKNRPVTAAEFRSYIDTLHNDSKESLKEELRARGLSKLQITGAIDGAGPYANSEVP